MYVIISLFSFDPPEVLDRYQMFQAILEVYVHPSKHGHIKKKHAMLGTCKDHEHGCSTIEVVAKVVLCFIIVALDWGSVWNSSCSYNVQCLVTCMYVNFRVVFSLWLFVFVWLENWTLHSLISHHYSWIAFSLHKCVTSLSFHKWAPRDCW